MAEQKVLLGSTQTLVSYPRLSPGGAPLMAQAASVTVRIATPAVSMTAAAYESATVDTLSTTLAASYGEGATEITLGAAQALVRGRRYLILPAASTPPLVVEHAGATATTTALVCAEPLPEGVASGDSFKGFAVSHALTAAETAVPGNALALWRASVDSVTYEWSQSFRVARRVPVVPITPSQLTQAYPVMHTLRAGTDATFEEVIQFAWQYRVLRALEAKGVLEENIVSTEVLEPLVSVACVYHLAVQDPTVSPDFVARMQADYERALDAALASRNWYEDEQSETPDPRPNTESPTPNRGALRLTR